MLVLRTVCSTDWKGRPSHSVVLVAKTENRKEAIAAMDKDVAEWMAVDIAADEWNDKEQEGIEPEEGSDVARTAELVATETPEELKHRWMEASAGNRWEMQMQDADHREFVERIGDSGEFCTTVYHLLKDNHEYTERR
jgi:hypothetical protein